MARVTEDLGGFTLGSGTPAEMTQRFNASNVAFEVVTDGTSPGGQALEIQKSGSGRNLLTLDSGDGDNQHGLVLMESDGNSALSLWINASGSSGSESGYLLELNFSANTIAIWRGISGSYTQLASSSMTLNTGTRYWVRLARFSDGDVVGRVWEAGNSEPASWTLSSTGQNNHTTGWCGVSELANATLTTTIHYLSIGNGANYDAACSNHEEDFPTSGIYYQCSEDDSIRLTDSDGSPNFLVHTVGDVNNSQQVRWHKTKQKLYLTCPTSGNIFRFDRFGLNRETVVSGVTNVFGITFDYDNSLMYYTTRESSSELYKNSDDGGSQSLIVSSINWAGHPFFHPGDGFVYVPYDHNVRSYDSSGTLQVTYGTLSNAHTVAVSSTHVFVGAWNNSGIWYQVIGGGAGWTLGDSTYRTWCIDIDEAETTIIGCNYFDDVLSEWDIFPTSGNRDTVLSGTTVNTVHSASYFEYTAPAGSGSGSGAGSGSGTAPGSGSGAPLPPFNTPAFKKQVARMNYERVVVWIPRSGAVVDVSGREGIIGPAPVGSTGLFEGGYSFRKEKSSTFAFRSLRPDAASLLRIMGREKCKARYIGLGTGRHQGGFVDMNLNVSDVRDPGPGFGGLSVRLNNRFIDSGECQFTDLLECFPWRCTTAVADESGGSGSGSGGSYAYYLEPDGDLTYEGPKWEVGADEFVDSIGTYFGSLATLEITLPIQGATFTLRGDWTGSINFKSWNGSILETTTKSTFEETPEVVVPDYTWSIQFIVDSADNPPCVTIDGAGAALDPRVGACLDCSDPDAVPADAPSWTDDDLRGFLLRDDNSHFYRFFGRIESLVDTGLDLSAYSIIDMDRDQVAGEVYGLASDGKVYKWKDDGKQGVSLIVDTGFSDFSRIFVDNVNKTFILSHHTAGAWNERFYIYTLAGAAVANFEQSSGSSSYNVSVDGIGRFGGETFVYIYRVAGTGVVGLTRWSTVDGAVDAMQGISGFQGGQGTILGPKGVGYGTVGSALHQWDPTTVNNPSNPPQVGALIPLTNSVFMDWFEDEDVVQVVGCDSGRVWRFNTGSGITVLNQTDWNVRTLCTIHDFNT